MPVCRRCLAPPEPLTFEYFCVCCKTPFLNEFPLDELGRCRLCREGLSGFDAAYCYGPFDGRLRTLIHLFKYSRMKPLSRTLSGYLALALPRDQRFDAVVPMPLDWLRRFRRGFNQSALLAESLAKRSGIPMLEAVRRRRGSAPQAGLSASARRKNVAKVFSVPRPEQVAGKRLLLVDDVMTTGATAKACASVLKQAGASYVALLSVARVDRRGSLPPAPPPGNELSAMATFAGES